MARRKSALVFLLLCIMVLVLSPWADAPSPAVTFVALPEGEASAPVEPEADEVVSRLTIEVALDDQPFHALSNLNDDFTFRHPHIKVELRRIEPRQAYETFVRASEREEAADIMLLENEWVKSFAASGYLLPADAAFAGKSMAEQFEALAGPLKWNGYLWGVPRDMDPFVLLWNRDVLRAWLGEEAELPLTLEQWTAAAEASEQTQGETAWLAIDRNDPVALFAWLESATGERSDGLWEKGEDPWNGTLRGQALALVERMRESMLPVDETGEAVRAVLGGGALAAVVPYSEATLIEERWPDLAVDLEIDDDFWELPYIWPRGSSFAISSRTEAEEAASAWIAEMTGEQAQLQNMEEHGKLPVYRSFYESDRRLAKLMPGRPGQSFPHQSPIASGPDLPGLLQRAGLLWRQLADGDIGAEAWIEAWDGA
ncbi:extracellular solute-binding protein [Paenibacillaceae bacterium WGS1546]|uniref:extracellular solute-binding protein n=1 Tax=Cohnella sp. WGS1546 TaxID=3366810 RepID=UPI00372D507C